MYVSWALIFDVCVLFRKTNKDDIIIQKTTDMKKTEKKAELEKLREQRKREREAEKAYEKWLNKKVKKCSIKSFYQLKLLFLFCRRVMMMSQFVITNN
jgi:hypothetical protein